MTAVFNNPFIKPAESYKRAIDPVNQYIQQAAHYLHIQTGDSIAQCITAVQAILRDKELAPKVKDPTVDFLVRPEGEDRHRTSTNLSNYIMSAVGEGRLMAPTFTTYLPPSVKESLIVGNVESEVTNRNRAKKAQFKYEMLAEEANAANNKAEYITYSTNASFSYGEQTSAKLSNNAVSGAMCSASTPLFNPTGHSTLTSTCRSTSGLGNANNEKLISGNRHYYNRDIVINNITSIVSNTDYEALALVLEPTGALRIPTAEQTIACIEYSSSLYWADKVQMDTIKDYVHKLTPMQRAAFVYTGDLYQIMHLNPEYMRGFIAMLSKGIRSNETNMSHPEALVIIKAAEEDILYLARQILQTEFKGRGKDHDKMMGEDILIYLAHTILNIQNTFMEYADFIRVIFMSNNLPASVAYFPDSIRRIALTSDTDSTIFTVQDWQIWYHGALSFSDDAMAVAATMIFLASQSIVHILATMSANFGISPKRLGVIAMKNEYKFDVFVPTSVGKHYFANKSCQEGNIYSERKIEIKGVHLKNSNSPAAVVQHGEELMEFILDKVIKLEKISLPEVLKNVADLERSIRQSIAEGKTEYLRLGQIKEAGAYKEAPNRSPYQHHTLWQTVFADKYISLPEPPYACAKVNTTLTNPSATKAWLASIQDKSIQEKMTKYVTAQEKTMMPTFYVPLDALISGGMPEEIFQIMNVRKIISDLCSMQYLILETLGFYLNSGNGRVLVSDTY